MLIWTPADGRRGTPPPAIDPATDAFAESASPDTPPTTPCGPTCADVFFVSHGEASSRTLEAEDDAWCAVDRETKTRDRIKVPT